MAAFACRCRLVEDAGSLRVRRRRTQGRGTTGGRRRIRGVGVLVATGGTADDGPRLAVLGVDDVTDDDGDVVGAAAAQSEFDEAVGAFARVGEGAERLGEGLLGDDVGQAVAAQQVAVARAGLAHGQGGFHLGAGECAHDEGSLRVGVRLLGRDPALVDEGLHKGVVAGDLADLPVAVHVAAGIADVTQADSVAREQDCGQRGAHALEFGGAFHLRGDRLVAGAGGALEGAEKVTAGFVGVEGAECFDDELAGHFARGVTAHAVGEGEQTRTGVRGILVVGADEAAVASREIAQDKGHGRNSITVLPIRIGVLIGTLTGVVTLVRSR